VGPGSILDAHTAQEKVNLAQIEEAVDLYQTLAKGLLAQGDAYLEPKR
jgi:acetylornithine deacetylase/succinyl-diaminopimelate desuccinylase-like protein